MRKPAVRMPRLSKKKTKSAKRTIPKNLKKYVKDIIGRNVENKQAVPYTANNQKIYPYGLGANGPHQLTCFDLTTPINGIIQGSDNGQRVGDSIKVKKLTVKGMINLDSSKANNEQYRKNPMYVRMFIGRRQDVILDPNTYGTTAFSDFFLSGPFSSNPQNFPTDMWRDVNKNVYRIYKTRLFKIGMSAPSNNPADSNSWNNDFKYSIPFSFDLSKHIDIVKYRSGQVQNTTQGIYMWFVVCWANGYAVEPLTSLTPLEIHFDVNADYEDA